MKYYNITFNWYGSECTELAKAECADDVLAYYAVYDKAPKIELADYYVIAGARKNGKPIVCCPPSKLVADTMKVLVYNRNLGTKSFSETYYNVISITVSSMSFSLLLSDGNTATFHHKDDDGTEWQYIIME